MIGWGKFKLIGNLMTGNPLESDTFPRWKKVLLAPLFLMTLPVSITVLLGFAVFVMALATAVWCKHWVRYPLTGIPIPNKWLAELPIRSRASGEG